MVSYPPFTPTALQLEMLSVIFDTFIDRLTPAEEEALKHQFRSSSNSAYLEVTEEQISAISRLSATSLNTPSVVIQYFSNHISPQKRHDLVRILDLLASRPGALAMTGHWKLLTELDRPQREQVMLSWKNSRLPIFRQLFNVMGNLCLFHAYSRTHSPLVDSIGHNAVNGDEFFRNHADYAPVEHERIPVISTKEAIANDLSFDVVVVGSGAGGGVAAAELAKAGYSVLVIEKGKYYHQSEMADQEETSFINMYDGGGSVGSISGSITCQSGSTLGGGTAVNYLASFRPPHYVREEWANLGLPHFASAQFSRDLDSVFGRIGASKEGVLQSPVSLKFEKGCNDLGYHNELVYVNTSGRPHYCSRCMMGCKAGIKNSTANTWLLDALHCGARFLDQTLVTRIVADRSGTKAIGVECQVHDSQQAIMIKAKRVIVACGGLRTPGLLKASNLKNPNIGKHLKLQPILLGVGFFDEPTRQNEGPLISRVCSTSEHCQGDNFGAKIEEVLLMPGGLASKLPWLGAAKHKELMLRYKSVASFANFIRDKDSVGKVDYDKKTMDPVYDYSLSKHDAKSLTICIERNMKILAAAGAREFYTSQGNVEMFAFRNDEPSSVDNPRFKKWLEVVSNAGISAVSTQLISVHQLGSCRMGQSPKSSALQPTGETWDMKNVYVADGSVFPTALGVNPMVTIEATALHIARQVVASMKTSHL